VPDPFTIAVLGVAGVGGIWATRGADEQRDPSPDDGGGTPDVSQDGGDGKLPPMTYSVEQWRSFIVDQAGQANQYVEFHAAWIAVESGGNPAAVGSIHATAPDGYAREIGLYQLYNPDEVTLAGVTSADLRAGCAAPTGTQQLIRPLTDDEKVTHIRAGVSYIAKRIITCDGYLASAVSDWNDRDRMRLVKLIHTLTGLPRAAVQFTRDRLGRGPTDWAELRATVESQDLSAYGGKNLQAYGPFTREFNNAEKVGGAVPV